MAQELDISSISVSDLLNKLRSRDWMIPAFQRNFVWTIGDVSDLVYSIFERRPIGMATVWQQTDDSLGLEPVSIPDRNKPAILEGVEKPPATIYAVLDGRQRCTAIAMAFGGLRPKDGRVKFCGRFFLNVAEKEDAKRIEYVREADLVNRGLDSESSAIGKGFFPLSSSNPEESLMQQWFRYTQAIQNAANYPDSKLPDTHELKRRNSILARSYEGLVTTKLAVSIVPSSYSLSEVCDIFEVLNTTGTKVSTVDLIHSWLLSETSKESSPINLRNWIDNLGEQPGAVGWSSSKDRPELIAQMTTAAYVLLESKPEPRRVGRAQKIEVTSVRSRDLLATPTLHWKNVRDNEHKMVEFLGDFQQCVAGGAFRSQACPYPVTASIYVGLRWHQYFDVDSTHDWDIADLNALFRAFFWRNALRSRYDQGVMTRLSKDINDLKSILNNRSDFANFNEWALTANKKLSIFMNKAPEISELRDLYSHRQTGALQKALLLPIITRGTKDLLKPEINIDFPTREDIQLHHIYPQDWCRNNCTGELSKWLDRDVSERDWVRSAANLIPLTRDSNNKWRSENPGAILHKKNMIYGDVFSNLFISNEAFDHLKNGSRGIPYFWETRANTLANYLAKFVKVTQ